MHRAVTSKSQPYIQLGSAQTLVFLHLKAYGGQVTLAGQGFGCSSSVACPSKQ